MRVGPYRMHFKKLGQHVINWIPPCADILQELQGFDFDNIRWLPHEPPFLFAIYNITMEGISMLTWSLNGSDRCASLYYGIRRNGVIIRQRVTIVVTSPIRGGMYHLSRAKIDNVSKAHDPMIVHIKENVAGCHPLLKWLHHCFFVCSIVESDMSYLVE